MKPFFNLIRFIIFCVKFLHLINKAIRIIRHNRAVTNQMKSISTKFIFAMQRKQAASELAFRERLLTAEPWVECEVQLSL